MPTFFPDLYFAGFYFGGGYWQEVDQSGAMSAALAGSATLAATATAVSVARPGGGSRRTARNWEYAVPLRDTARPAPIAARIRSASAITAMLTATTSMAAAIGGQTLVTAQADAADLFVAADNNFWLMAA